MSAPGSGDPDSYNPVMSDRRAKLDALLAHTLRKSDVSDYVRLHLKPLVRGSQL